MQIAHQEGAILLLEQVHRPAACRALAWGDHATARRLTERGLRLAHESGVPGREIPVRAGAALSDFLTGAWDSATTSADDLLGLSHRVGARRGVAAALHPRARTHPAGSFGRPRNACRKRAASITRASPAISTCSASVTQAMSAARQRKRHLRRRGRPIHRAGRSAIRPFSLRLLGEAQVAVGNRPGHGDCRRHRPGRPERSVPGGGLRMVGRPGVAGGR